LRRSKGCTWSNAIGVDFWWVQNVVPGTRGGQSLGGPRRYWCPSSSSAKNGRPWRSLTHFVYGLTLFSGARRKPSVVSTSTRMLGAVFFRASRREMRERNRTPRGPRPPPTTHHPPPIFCSLAHRPTLAHFIWSIHPSCFPVHLHSIPVYLRLSPSPLCSSSHPTQRLVERTGGEAQFIFAPDKPYGTSSLFFFSSTSSTLTSLPIVLFSFLRL
jgi:hypothetical protein